MELFYLTIVLLVNIKASIAIKCYACKESDGNQWNAIGKIQCGEYFRAGPNSLPEVECDGVCVTFKNVYDGGCKSFFVFIFALVEIR